MNKELLYKIAHENDYETFNTALRDELGTDDIIIIYRNKVDYNFYLELICNFYNVTPEAVLSRTRCKDVKDARFMFSYYMRVEKNQTFQKIGTFLLKDHASVMHHVRKVSDWIQVYPIVKYEYDKLIEYIQLNLCE